MPRPRRGASRVDAPDARAEPIANGIPVSPACRAVKPSPICSQMVKVRKKAGMPMKKMPASSSPATKARWRNRSRSTRGEPSVAFLRRSQAANSSSTGTAAAMDANVHGGQPRSRPSTSG